MNRKEVMDRIGYPLIVAVSAIIITGIGSVIWNYFQEIDFSNPYVKVIMLLSFLIVFLFIFLLMEKMKTKSIIKPISTKENKGQVTKEPATEQKEEIADSSKNGVYSYNVKDYVRCEEVDVEFLAKISKSDPTQYTMSYFPKALCTICRNPLRKIGSSRNPEFSCDECNKEYDYCDINDEDYVTEIIEEHLHKTGHIYINE